MSDDLAVPHDLDAERAVLGGVMVEGARFADAAAVLGSSAFYRLAHRQVWQACERLHLAGTPIDFLTLRDSLDTAGHLDEVTVMYLASLVDGVPKAMNVAAYAGIVRDKADARALVTALQQGIRAVSENGPSPDVLGPLAEALRLGGDLANGIGHQRRVADV